MVEITCRSCNNKFDIETENGPNPASTYPGGTTMHGQVTMSITFVCSGCNARENPFPKCFDCGADARWIGTRTASYPPFRKMNSIQCCENCKVSRQQSKEEGGPFVKWNEIVLFEYSTGNIMKSN